MDYLYQFNTCGSGYQAFPLLADVPAFEEGLDDIRTGGWAADAVLLQCVAKFFVFHQFACRFHGA